MDSPLKKLPGLLLGIRRDTVKHRSLSAAITTPNDVSDIRLKWLDKLETLFSMHGLADAETFARSQAANPLELAATLTRLARLELRSNALEAQRLARESLRLDPRPFRRKWLAFLLFDSGHISEAHELLLSLPHDQQFSSSERAKAIYIAGCYRLLSHLPVIPGKIEWSAYEPVLKRLLYVASSSLPYHVTGYTLRTHEIVKAIRAQGWEAICVTRPGYPDDRDDAQDKTLDSIRIVGDIMYESLPGPHRRKTALDQYIAEAAKIIEAKALIEKPAFIHAASNYETALPALIAARRLGIPFIYEVRGLWEYTSASKILGWEQTERFSLDRRLETCAVKNADHVFTLTQALADELVIRGADARNISLAPNAIDPESFMQNHPKEDLTEKLGLSGAPFVVGYIGSVVAYEGLDDLVSAFKILIGQISGAKLIIAGDGDALPSLQSQVRALGLETDVVFTGRLPHAEIPLYYALLNAIALPRKPFKVCHLVSPLKPLEAMAMGVPLVVSDVSALREMVLENETALVHRSGDIDSLAENLMRLANDRGLAESLALAARMDVMSNHTWKKVAAKVSQVYLAITKTDDYKSIYIPGARERRKGYPEMSSEFQDSYSGDIEPVRLSGGNNAMTDGEKRLLEERLGDALKKGGAIALKLLLSRQTEGRPAKFGAFCTLKAANAALAGGYVDTALELAEVAIEKEASIAVVRGVTRLYYNASILDKASERASWLESMQRSISESDRKFIGEVQGREQLAIWAAAPPALRKIPLVKGRVLNVLAFSLPYTSVGYATRSHGLAVGIKNAGWEIRPYTRPGFPYDFKPELEGQILPDRDEIDGIVYRRIFDIKRRGMREVEYLLSAISHFERIITDEQPEVVHAASNYVTALPAIIAARRLGVPFIYEIRGFWEVTRSSRDEAFENTPKYRFMQLFDKLLARQADHVITITGAMKEELIKRGIPHDKISIVHNSVDPERFISSPPDRLLAEKLGIPEGTPVIGYIGSFVDYEGLDDLIVAAAGLKERGLAFRLLMVGDGAEFVSIEEQISSFGLEDRTILTGRVPHEQVENYYSLVDIAPFPRKPWQVCELVSPLKPFEAMALEKAVVVSGVMALAEIVEDGVTGLIFEKGNTESLRDALAALIVNPEKRRDLGKAAREWVIRERTWDVAGVICTNCYEALTKQK